MDSVLADIFSAPRSAQLLVAASATGKVPTQHMPYRVLGSRRGFDHGVGHPLLLLYDAKTPRGQKIKGFNGLGDDPFNASIGLF